MLQLLQSPRDGAECGGDVGAIRRFDRAAFFAPLVQGTLRDMQLLTQRFDEFAFFITVDSFNFQVSGIGGRHSLGSFVGDETMCPPVDWLGIIWYYLVRDSLETSFEGKYAQSG